MGVMINGTYQSNDPGPDSGAAGEFKRAASTIRNWITADGMTGFAPDTGRYHLFAAWNCPWAHRVLATRAVLGLRDAISVSYALPRRTPEGWVFDASGDYADPLMSARALHEIYAAHPEPYTGRVTVPVLWDKTLGQIVSNESADIMRMLGRAFDPDARLCPDHLIKEIDAWNALTYPTLNNGVYRAGFARSQEAYDRAVAEVFETLDKLDAHLSHHKTLVGDSGTEADLRVFPTLVRFDVAYHYAFKCNIRRLMDYPNLWDYARALWALPGLAETVKPEIYKTGYFSQSDLRNPLGIVPAGPQIDWAKPAKRTLSV